VFPVYCTARYSFSSFFDMHSWSQVGMRTRRRQGAGACASAGGRPRLCGAAQRCPATAWDWDWDAAPGAQPDVWGAVTGYTVTGKRLLRPFLWVYHGTAGTGWPFVRQRLSGAARLCGL